MTSSSALMPLDGDISELKLPTSTQPTDFPPLLQHLVDTYTQFVTIVGKIEISDYPYFAILTTAISQLKLLLANSKATPIKRNEFESVSLSLVFNNDEFLLMQGIAASQIDSF